MCTRRLLLEVCTLDDSLDLLAVSVDLEPTICYVDRDRYLQDADALAVMQEAVQCATSDYWECQENKLAGCKFIDCFYAEDQDPAAYQWQAASKGSSGPAGRNTDAEAMRQYLFSACIPKRFGQADSINVCHEVALGNDYLDYFESRNDEDIHVVNRWKFNVGGPFATSVILVISVSLCLLCGLSCFYNYRVHHGHGPPFTVCGFCPECLFPQGDLNQQPINPEDLEDSVDSQGKTPAGGELKNPDMITPGGGGALLPSGHIGGGEARGFG
jgi:hypothetical protein